MLQNLFLFIITMIFSIDLIKCSDSKVKEKSKQCLQAGLFWSSIYEVKNPNNVTDSYVCTQISKSCCYINIKYSYNSRNMDQNLCFPLTGQPSSWIRLLKNQLKDELMYYANSTNDNWQVYKSIGGNLVYTYYQNYTCTDLHPIEDYSSYEIINCAAFNSDGSCRFQKDIRYFENFAKVLYENVTSDYCFNFDEKGNCINYKDKAQPKELNNLLEILKHDFNIDKNIQKVDDKFNNKTIYNLPRPCKPIPEVKVEITCPPEYTSGNFITLSFLYIILIFILSI